MPSSCEHVDLPAVSAANAPYPDVRALRRGLSVMEAIGAAGWARPGELAMATGIDRSTIYRLVDTLIAAGFVIRRGEDGAFALTDKVRSMADGVTQNAIFLEQFRPHLAKLTTQIHWPSDLALLKGGSVTIEDSTHRLSPITFHRATIGQRRSLFDTALGRAIMMQLSSEELELMIEIATASGGTDYGAEYSQARLLEQVDSYRQAGYAWATGSVDPNVSAIAMGFRGPDSVIRSVNIVFFRRVLSPSVAADRYLPALKQCIAGANTALPTA